MKSYFVIVFLTLNLTTLKGLEEKRCHSSSDCAENECCVRRGLFSFRKGDCKTYADVGERCSEEKESFFDFTKKYDSFCPCSVGLTCEPTDIKDTWFGTVRIDERCVEPTTVAHTESDVTPKE